MTENGTLAGFEVELEEGQSWDDEVTITMSREHMVMACTMLMAQAHELLDATENASRAAANGDFQARIVLPALHANQQRSAELVIHFTEVLFPNLAKQAMDAFRRTARANADA